MPPPGNLSPSPFDKKVAALNHTLSIRSPLPSSRPWSGFGLCRRCLGRGRHLPGQCAVHRGHRRRRGACGRQGHHTQRAHQCLSNDDSGRYWPLRGIGPSTRRVQRGACAGRTGDRPQLPPLPALTGLSERLASTHLADPAALEEAAIEPAAGAPHVDAVHRPSSVAPTARDARRVSDAASWIETRAHEDRDALSLDVLAHLAGLSPWHFLRVFRSVMGMSASAYRAAQKH